MSLLPSLSLPPHTTPIPSHSPNRRHHGSGVSAYPNQHRQGRGHLDDPVLPQPPATPRPPGGTGEGGGRGVWGGGGKGEAISTIQYYPNHLPPPGPPVVQVRGEGGREGGWGGGGKGEVISSLSLKRDLLPLSPADSIRIYGLGFHRRPHPTPMYRSRSDLRAKTSSPLGVSPAATACTPAHWTTAAAATRWRPRRRSSCFIAASPPQVWCVGCGEGWSGVAAG